MMEPDDLWAGYLEGPHRADLPRFFGGQQQKLGDGSDHKGHADTVGMEVAGLTIPARVKAAGATASIRNQPCPGRRGRRRGLDDQWEKFGRRCEHQQSMLLIEYFQRQRYNQHMAVAGPDVRNPFIDAEARPFRRPMRKQG